VSLKLWKRLNYVVIAVTSLMTVFCVTPGPGQALGQNLVYLTFISHVALLLACMASISGLRSEEAQDS
jgi:hypothetical protein